MTTRRDVLRASAGVVLGATLTAETAGARPAPAPKRSGYLLLYPDGAGPTACGKVVIVPQDDGSFLVWPDPTSAEGWLAG